MISRTANDVARERIAKGKKVAFPQGKTVDSAFEQTDYPKDVWQEATKKWNAIPPDERTKLMAEQDQQTEELVGELKGALREGGFKDSFSAFDILWFVLATMTAFRIGSGAVSSD